MIHSRPISRPVSRPVSRPISKWMTVSAGLVMVAGAAHVTPAAPASPTAATTARHGDRAEALTGTISGTVFSSYPSSDISSRGLMVTVRVFKSTDTAQASPVASILTTATGGWTLKVAAGNYVLRADPTADYQTGYYASTATVTSFSQATVVVVKASRVYSNLNLTLKTNLVDLANAKPITSTDTIRVSEPSGLVWSSYADLLYYVGDEDTTHLYALNPDGSGADRFSLLDPLVDTEALLWRGDGSDVGDFYILTSQAASTSSGNETKDRQRVCQFKLKSSDPVNLNDSTYDSVDFAASDGKVGSFKKLLEDAVVSHGIPLSPKGVNVEGFAFVGGTAPSDQWLVGLKDPVTTAGQALLLLVQGFESYFSGTGTAQVVGFATVDLHGQGFSDLSRDPIHAGQYLFTSGSNDYYTPSDARPRFGTLTFSGLLAGLRVSEAGMTQTMHHPEGVARIVLNPSVPTDVSNQRIALVFDDENGTARFARFLSLTLP